MEDIKVSPEVAKAEVTKWLDHKKVNAAQREAYETFTDRLEGAVSTGNLVLEDDHSWTQNLLFPVGSDGGIKSITYKPRLSKKDVDDAQKGVKSGDIDARNAGYLFALTGKAMTTFTAMDTEDYKLAQAISIFFVV